MADLNGVRVTMEGAECPDDDAPCKLEAVKCCTLPNHCHWCDVRRCVSCGGFEVDADAFAMATPE